MDETTEVAVIGLGSMGFGMAGALLGAGHRVYGFDVTRAGRGLPRGGGSPGRSPRRRNGSPPSSSWC